MEVEALVPEREGTVESGGARIAYRCFGDPGSAPLLLLHGNGEDYACFSKLIPSFSETYYLVAPDARGHGASGDGDPFTLEQMARDARAVLGALQIQAAHVLGFSDGANVALLMALQSLESVRTLILIGGNLFPDGLQKKALAQMRREEKRTALKAKFKPELKKKLRLLSLMTQQPQIDPRRLGTLAVPSLVIAGDADVIEEAHTRLIAQSLPNSHMRTVPSCGHFPLREQPEWTCALIRAFLKREGGGK